MLKFNWFKKGPENVPEVSPLQEVRQMFTAEDWKKSIERLHEHLEDVLRRSGILSRQKQEHYRDLSADPTPLLIRSQAVADLLSFLMALKTLSPKNFARDEELLFRGHWDEYREIFFEGVKQDRVRLVNELETAQRNPVGSYEPYIAQYTEAFLPSYIDLVSLDDSVRQSLSMPEDLWGVELMNQKTFPVYPAERTNEWEKRWIAHNEYLVEVFVTSAFYTSFIDPVRSSKAFPIRERWLWMRDYLPSKKTETGRRVRLMMEAMRPLEESVAVRDAQASSKAMQRTIKDQLEDWRKDKKQPFLIKPSVPGFSEIRFLGRIEEYGEIRKRLERGMG